MTGRKPKKLNAFLWHRRIGLFAIALVIILAVTGILLNHTEEFRLDETYIDNALVLGWYGIEPEDDPRAYAVQHAGTRHLISAWQNRLFFDNQSVTTLEQTLHGVIPAEQFIVAALDDEIILLSYQGELVERVSTRVSFSNIQRLGLKYERPVIETSDGLFYMADEHILDWDVTANEGIHWSQTYTLNEDEYHQLLIAYRGMGLKLERIILDLHSGRIFGHYGIYLMDAAAIALLWLSLSGLWVWSSRRRKMRRKKHYRKHHKVR